jgi:DNA-binding transcriptional ArsR family regulator
VVHSRSKQLDETFFALSDPTRRALLSRLAEQDRTVAELAEPFEMSAPAISKHLRVLERAGLLEQKREGRMRRCRLIATPLAEAATWVETYRQFWEQSLDRLEAYLETIQKPSPQKSNKEK